MASSILEKMAELTGVNELSSAEILQKWRVHEADRFSRTHTVFKSPDIDRIKNLPSREPLDVPELGNPLNVSAAALVDLMNARLGLGNRACNCANLKVSCITTLLPTQAWTLYEAGLVGGILGQIGVGHGKTALNFLLPLVIPNVKLAVVLVPSKLREQMKSEYLRWREHWRVPSIRIDDWGVVVPGMPVVHVMPYTKLSMPQSTAYLDSLRPDLIINDEAQNLRAMESTRRKRFFRYYASNPTTRGVSYSGTLMARTIKDCANLSAVALGAGSPLPLDPDVVDRWAAALDPTTGRPAAPGALETLLRPGRDLRESVHQRITETPGVITTRHSSIGASLYVYDFSASKRRSDFKLPPLRIPTDIRAIIEKVRLSGERPDGDPFIDHLAVAKCLRELAAGFYYRWRFPRNEPEECIEEWRRARKAYFQELRVKLQAGEPHLDSPALCYNAAARAYQQEPYDGNLPVWYSATWPAWHDIKDQVYHETEAVWCSDFLLQDCAAWAHHNRGIIWYDQAAFGEKLAKMTQLPLHRGGVDAEERIRSERGDRSIIASIDSHGTGRDGLQHLFCKQLVANPPTSGQMWEQLFGRLHRPGQKADVVETDVFRHSREMSAAFGKAARDAKFVTSIMGIHQKLLAASCDFDLIEEIDMFE